MQNEPVTLKNGGADPLPHVEWSAAPRHAGETRGLGAYSLQCPCRGSRREGGWHAKVSSAPHGHTVLPQLCGTQPRAEGNGTTVVKQGAPWGTGVPTGPAGARVWLTGPAPQAATYITTPDPHVQHQELHPTQDPSRALDFGEETRQYSEVSLDASDVEYDRMGGLRDGLEGVNCGAGGRLHSAPVYLGGIHPGAHTASSVCPGPFGCAVDLAVVSNLSTYPYLPEPTGRGLCAAPPAVFNKVSLPKVLSTPSLHSPQFDLNLCSGPPNPHQR